MMNFDEPTMNLDELQARIDEVCRADDRLRAARQWEAERRRKDAPLVRKSAPDVIRRDIAPAENRADQSALQCTQPITSPVPSTDTDEARIAGWERWLQGHLEIERGHLIAVLGEEFSATRNELLDRIEPQLEKQLGKISALELKLAELTGAVDVLRGKEPPPPARFPRVKAWREDAIYYEGDVVAFAGGTYQARRDTAHPPGARDWVCLATAGRSLTVRGTYNGDIDYRCLDVVMINGSSFVALKDSPGVCPGDDWQLLCSRGSRGERGRGERGFTGLRGERGQAAPIIESWEVDRTRYVATPVMSDGSRGPPLELRGLFEQFTIEREMSGV